MKHTKGPWTTEAVMSEALQDICLGYEIPGAGTPILIASVYEDDHGFINYLEAEANARLIAAAPELLEQLQIAIAILEADWEGDEPSQACNEMRAVVAKAKGLSP